MVKRFLRRGSDLISDRDRGIVRKELYFSRTAGVPQPEYEALKAGFTRIIAEAGRNIKIRDFGCFNAGTGDYSSPDWYQEQALADINRKDKGFGRQVSAYVINDLLWQEPFQKQNPHFDVMIFDKDLTTSRNDPSNNFIFGYGPYPNNILSVKRFLHWIRDDKLRYACLAIMGAHEFGHNLDLVARNFNIGSKGYEAGHCDGQRGPCLMEQVNVEDKRPIDKQTKLLIDREHWLCPDCLEEIAFRRDYLKREGILW